jgi:hypothetical protein
MSGGDGARGYLVECYWPGVTEQAVADAAHRAVQAAAEIRRQGHDVDFLTAILVPADETIFCLFEGQEAAVRTASDRAGIPVERVLESVRVDGTRVIGEPDAKGKQTNQPTPAPPIRTGGPTIIRAQ